MGIELQASDGHRFAAYRADPEGTPRGGIVTIQELFGLNDHVRGVCDGCAAVGLALFDRVKKASSSAIRGTISPAAGNFAALWDGTSPC